jgi:uncharacterized protein
VTIVFGLLAIFMAGFTYGLTGFGFGLVSVPLLLLVLPPQSVVPITLLLASVTGVLVVWEAWRCIQIRRIWPLLVGGVMGIPVGTWVLTVLDANVLKVIIGAIISLSALAFLCGFHKPVGREKLTSIPIGVASGIMNGATGMSGPPVILFFSNQGVEKSIFRANLATYFLILNLITFPAQWVGGLLTRDVFTHVLWFLPALALGSWLGIRLAQRVNENLFRRVALTLVAATGIISVTNGLRVF